MDSKKIIILLTIAAILLLVFYTYFPQDSVSENNISAKPHRAINAPLKTINQQLNQSPTLTNQSQSLDVPIQLNKTSNNNSANLTDTDSESLLYAIDSNTSKKEYCGNNVCSTDEKRLSNCCIDCGCGTGKVCNSNKLTCQTALAPFSNERETQLLESFKQTNAGYANFTFNYSYDSTFQDQSVKVMVINCRANQTYPCYAYLVVDKDGRVLSTYSSN